MKPNRFILFAFLFTITLLSIANAGFSKKKRLPGGVFVDEPGDFLTNTTIMIDEYEVYPARKKRIKFGVNFDTIILAGEIFANDGRFIFMRNLYLNIYIGKIHFTLLMANPYKHDYEYEPDGTNQVYVAYNSRKEGIFGYQSILWYYKYMSLTHFSVSYNTLNLENFEFLVGLSGTTAAVNYYAKYIGHSTLEKPDGFYAGSLGITLTPSFKANINGFIILLRIQVNVPIIQLNSDTVLEIPTFTGNTDGSVPITITPIFSIGFEI